MKVREICEMVEEQVVLACGGTEEEAEARRGADGLGVFETVVLAPVAKCELESGNVEGRH